jgi:formylmethanofuran dehydrogenase subunit E
MIDDRVKNSVPIKDSDGHTVIDIGIIATFYLGKGWDNSVKDAVAKCFEHYQSLFGTMLRWANNTHKKSWVRTNSKQIMSPANLFALESIHENTPWEFHYHGGDSSEAWLARFD